MIEGQQVPPEVLIDLGLDPDSFAVEWYPSESRIQKVLGRCPDCKIPLFAYKDRETGDTIPALCPRKGQAGSEQCFWGARGTLPLGEE